MKKLFLTILSVFAVPALAMEEQGAALMKAIQDSDVQRVQDTIATGIDLNAKYPCQVGIFENGRLCIFSRTPLCLCAEHTCDNNKEAIKAISKLLIDSGADVNQPEYPRDTTFTHLHSAICSQNEPICKIFIAAGADVNVKRMEIGGKTPLMIFASQGNAPMCRILCAAGAKINDQDVHGNTALIYTIKPYDETYTNRNIDKKIEVCEVLTEYGAYIAQKNNYGENALIYDGMAGDLHTLLSHKCKIQKNRVKTTLLCLTRMKNNGDQCARFLLRHFREFLFIDVLRTVGLEEIQPAPHLLALPLAVPAAPADEPNLYWRLRDGFLNMLRNWF